MLLSKTEIKIFDFKANVLLLYFHSMKQLLTVMDLRVDNITHVIEDFVVEYLYDNIDKDL